MIAHKILITSGGTGGHIFPAIALAAKLKKEGFEVYSCFDPRSSRYINMNEPDIFLINILNTQGRGIVGKLKYLLNILQAILSAISILNKIKPDLVIGFGGYTTFPILFAASMLSKAKIIIHESNSVIGKVNKIFLSKVTAIAGGFNKIEDIAPQYQHKLYYTGTPVRESIEKIKPKPGEDVTNILIFGGSQAAKKFSSIIPNAILMLQPNIKSKLHIIQQVKEEDVEQIRALYKTQGISCEIASFFTDIEQKYRSANLVIARSGASTISELIKLEIPSILIPLPNSAKDHQLKNALYLSDNNCAEMIEEKDITNKKLVDKIVTILNNSQAYKNNLAQCRVDANQKIINLVRKVLQLT
jgi:UDP-N-acetylglucosamine--N-acetylmuramyl-(pentapeptide) pyrophosphoryl-undecaprenol N-acetylglucosamine transferase